MFRHNFYRISLWRSASNNISQAANNVYVHEEKFVNIIIAKEIS